MSTATARAQRCEELIVAAQRDDLAGARLALERGAAVDDQGPGGANALMFACQSGSEEMVRLLLELGPELNRRDDLGNTPLIIACRAGHGRVASDLVRVAGVWCANDDGYTALMGAARSGDQQLVELLLASGADPTFTYAGGDTAAGLAGSAHYYEVASLLQRAEVLWLLKEQKRYLRNFSHSVESRGDQQRFIFYKGTPSRYWRGSYPFFSAWWDPAERRLDELRWWTETEFQALLSHGQYGPEAAKFTGEFSEIPETVLKEAPARELRCRKLVALLSKGTRRLALDRPWRAADAPKWFLWCRDSQWFLVIGRDLQPCSEERARDEIEETLRHGPDAQPIPVKPAGVKRAGAATHKARGALQRLYQGEVWHDKGRLRFAHGSRLYLGFRRGKGPVTSVAEQSEQSVFEELGGRYARGGKLKIAPAPEVRQQVALLVEESLYPSLLREGKIQVGGGAPTESTWSLYCRDGRYFRASASSPSEIGEQQALEILREKRYGWVEQARPVPWGRAGSLPELVAEIDRLTEQHTDAEIAAILNERGYFSGAGLPINPRMVSRIRRDHGLKGR